MGSLEILGFFLGKGVFFGKYMCDGVLVLHVELVEHTLKRTCILSSGLLPEISRKGGNMCDGSVIHFEPSCHPFFPTPGPAASLGEKGKRRILKGIQRNSKYIPLVR